MNDDRVLVVGGAGYIGPIVCQHLLGAGMPVTCLDRLVYANGCCVTPLLGRAGFRFVYGDMADPAEVREAAAGSSAVVVLAGLVGDPITKKYPAESHAINDFAIQSLITGLNGTGIKRMVFVSTCSNYGLSDGDALLNEDAPLRPLSAYARSKVAAEQLLLSSLRSLDYSPTVLRFATAFGVAPRTRFDLTVNEFALELSSGRPLSVYDADTWRPYCHVQDFARAIHMALTAPPATVAGQVFNVGGEGNNHTKRQIVEIIQAQLGPTVVNYQQAGSDARNYKVDFSKIRRTLGFEPAVTVSDGVRELLAAIRGHLFDDSSARRSFYGNYEVNYPLRAAT